MLSTLATAALFLLLARFGLGDLMRYMPYPVVGGFLAGVGWLLVQGSFSITVGVSLSWSELPRLLEAEKLLRLAPAATLTLGLLAALKRWNNVFILPGALLLALAGFGLYLSSADSPSEAGAARAPARTAREAMPGLFPSHWGDPLDALMPESPACTIRWSRPSPSCHRPAA